MWEVFLGFLKYLSFWTECVCVYVFTKKTYVWFWIYYFTRLRFKCRDALFLWGFAIFLCVRESFLKDFLILNENCYCINIEKKVKDIFGFRAAADFLMRFIFSSFFYIVNNYHLILVHYYKMNVWFKDCLFKLTVLKKVYELLIY